MKKIFALVASAALTAIAFHYWQSTLASPAFHVNQMAVPWYFCLFTGLALVSLKVVHGKK
jgi:hypothetical protein